MIKAFTLITVFLISRKFQFKFKHVAKLLKQMDINDEYNGIEKIVEMLKAVALRKGMISPYY
jgi:hypothetical protein